MMIKQQPLCNLSAEAQENETVFQLQNEMKLVMTTKLSRYDMKLLTLMLKELIERIEILQFRCYFKIGMSLHKLMCPV